MLQYSSCPPTPLTYCRPHTLTSTSTSKSFQSTITGEISAPYSKQFVHSKSSQYRKMKAEWKGNVYLARSRIQVSAIGSISICALFVELPTLGYQGC